MKTVFELKTFGCQSSTDSTSGGLPTASYLSAGIQGGNVNFGESGIAEADFGVSCSGKCEISSLSMKFTSGPYQGSDINFINVDIGNPKYKKPGEMTGLEVSGNFPSAQMAARLAISLLREPHTAGAATRDDTFPVKEMAQSASQFANSIARDFNLPELIEKPMLDKLPNSQPSPTHP